MELVKKIFSYFSKGAVQPERGYDLWAAAYDSQPGNLMLALDEQVFSTLLRDTAIDGKAIVDVGCGTGRHWPKLFAEGPGSITGYDVSAGMLQVLKDKFPAAVVHKLEDERLQQTAEASTDIVVSTLTVAHIKNIGKALSEWNRVVKPGGYILITDYHPGALERGGRRTFRHGDKTVAIENNIHTIGQMTGYAKQLGWRLLRLEERKIDESVRHFYEEQSALALYESFKGVSIIYGLLFEKNADQ